MTVEVGNIITSFIAPLTYIDKLAGVIKVITKSDLNSSNVSIKKTFPVACGISFNDCLSSGKYKDLIPDSNIGCMVYLEDNGARVTGRNGSKVAWTANYKLVGWINQKKLGYNEECSITSKIIQDIIFQFPNTPQQIISPIEFKKYQKLLIEVEGQDPKSYNPFSKFSYDEDKTQYLMFPFDYFSLNINVSFEIDKQCNEPFVIQTPNNC